MKITRQSLPWVVEIAVPTIFVIFFYWLGNPTVSAISALVGILLANNRYYHSQTNKRTLQPIETKISNIATLIDIENEKGIEKISECIKIYKRITKSGLVGFKDQIIFDAETKLVDMDRSMCSEPVWPLVGKNYSEKIFGRATVHDEIMAVHFLRPENPDQLSDVNINKPDWQAYLELNLEAAKNGATVRRIFIVDDINGPLLRDLQGPNRDWIKAHTKEASETRKKGYKGKMIGYYLDLKTYNNHHAAFENARPAFEQGFVFIELDPEGKSERVLIHDKYEFQDGVPTKYRVVFDCDDHHLDVIYNSFRNLTMDEKTIKANKLRELSDSDFI